MTKLGVALGGGGIAGCAHLGVLQALEDNGIEIHCLAGTSSGALVAALYAYGYTIRELIELVPTLTKEYLDYDYKALLDKLWRRGVKIQGFIKGQRLHQLVSAKTRHASMRDLKLPVAILSADLKQARKVIFASRPLARPCQDADLITDIQVADAVLSSCSIPVLFKPVYYQDRVLVDGGILDNCPISALHALGADKVIAIDLVSADPVDVPFDSCLSILSRVVSINLATQSKELSRVADLVLQPEARRVGVFDFSKANYCIETGYECTEKRIEEILQLLH